MRNKKCMHTWEMVNVAHGLVVMKKCFHCAKISTCFTFHSEPPLESCHEGAHFWNYMESEPCFDLRCTKCGTLIKLDELVALMICTGCDQKCEVDILRRKLEPEGTYTYIALGCRPVDERKQLSQEERSVLQDYFNQQCTFLDFKLTIVSHELIKRFENCFAKVIENPEMLLVKPSEVK
jgi:hypothetical protein